MIVISQSLQVQEKEGPLPASIEAMPRVRISEEESGECPICLVEWDIVVHGVIHGFLVLLVVVVFSLCSSSCQGIKLPYMTSNVEEVSGKFFYYIVVGGGACGCPLAATLSEQFSVLLVERGGSPYGNPLVSEGANYGLSLIETNEFTSIAQSFVSEEGVMNHRGRVLGGSTAINSGFYSRASEDFVERVGWDKRLVREAYEWVESKVVFRPSELSPWQSIVKDSLVEGANLSFNGFSWEHLVGTKVGGSIFDGQGRRHTAADLLGAGNSKKLAILLNATVKNVIFHANGDGIPRAVGIRFMESNNNGDETYEAFFSDQQKDSKSWGDVILSADALSSPQILMLSGIGPLEHLECYNIPVLINAKAVGEGIKDNPAFSLLVDSPETGRTDLPQVVGITHDFQVIIQSVIRYISSNETRSRVGAKLTYPISKGKLELKNTDLRQNPSVRFSYLVEEKDLEQCVEMGRLLEKVATSIKSFLANPHNEMGKQSSTKEELRKFCQTNVKTFYHYHGGCGAGSVVDENYKVYGVNGLRVLDGSTLPDSPGTNPMATLLMLGRYQGIKILEERNQALVSCLLEFDDKYMLNFGKSGLY
ncbi:hypothetical protein GIB67_007367 [Kingdonia uniflora]|uniref:Glucose-methanol-choline oxidoreductase N-terminal domain-containing protein n=1 Tax=Kingdonia uniflora TaxID=39325 RepID=A0A7J7NXB1_9MAGN|nr:hypothetical protein GIB67_007367 [Kingdonia uniflora]